MRKQRRNFFYFVCAVMIGYIEVSDFCVCISSSPGADEQRIGGVFFGCFGGLFVCLFFLFY